MGNHQGKSIKLGAYHLHFVKQIAEGGFSYVFLVKDSNTSKHFALKRILIRDNEELNKVKNEINIMKQLSKHKNIVKFIDFQKTNGDKSGNSEIFILMEYCSGGHLVEIMQKRINNRMNAMEILKIFSEICEAVCHMHTQTPLIIHRDLKVENVLLDEETGTYKLCDFGSATTDIRYIRNKSDMNSVEEDISKNTTLQYRAPEIVDLYRCTVVNEKIDIWALGVLLYKLLFYTTPFEDAGTLGILNCNYLLPPPNSPTYPQEILTLVKVILSPEPEQRPNIFEIINQVSILRGNSLSLPYPSFKSNIISPRQIPKPLPQVPQHLKNINISNSLGSNINGNGLDQSLPHSTQTSPPQLIQQQQQQLQQQQQQQQQQISPTQQENLGGSFSSSPNVPRAHSPTLTTSARDKRRNPPSNNVTPSLFSLPLPAQNNQLPFNLDDDSNNPSLSTSVISQELEEIGSLINYLINTNVNSFDSSLIAKLKTHTNLYKQGGKGIMSVILKKPQREPIICFKSLLLIQILLSEGGIGFKSDVYDNKDLFNNLHLGWLKQKDFYPLIGEFLSSHSLLIHKLVSFYHRYHMIDGGFSMKWISAPENYDGNGPISLVTVHYLSEIMDQIFLVLNSILEVSLGGANQQIPPQQPQSPTTPNSSGSPQSPILPIPLLIYAVNILNSISYSIYCFISGSLELLSKVNLPDSDLKFLNSVSNFQSIHQALRDQYSKFYLTPIFSDQFFPTLPNHVPQFNMPPTSTNSDNPFSTGNSLEPSFNPFAPSNNDNFFDNNPLGISSTIHNPNSNNNNITSPISPPFKPKGLPPRFPHSASLEDARLYTLILTPSASPPLSPSIGRLGHSHTSIQTFDINQHVNNNNNGNNNNAPPKFPFPTQLTPQQSHPNSLNSSFNNNLFITPSTPTSLNSSSHNPFENPNNIINSSSTSTNNLASAGTVGSGHNTGGNVTPINGKPGIPLSSLKPLSTRGHRRSQSSTTDDVRRRNLLQQQIDQNREFQRHQRLVNMKSNQNEDLLNELDNQGSFSNDEEEGSSLL